MTVLVFHSSVLWTFPLFHPSMEKNAVKTSKPSSSISQPSNNARVENYCVSPNGSSFSSGSNDSSIYSSSSSVQTRAKRNLVNQLTGSHKRSRNSSGSSISSCISGISEKDLKSGIMSPAVTETEIKNCISNDVKFSQQKFSKIDSNNELNETMVDENLDYSKNSIMIIPNQHNLRGKITKKACTCCPSTCATVVLRQYKRYVKSGEAKTVISSTKVKAYVKQSSTPTNLPLSNEENSTSSTRSRTKKRKSEIEKLYDSLHEIEWAKNFSPDNILRQINVRQAASCSAFGHSHNNAIPSPLKKQKETKNRKVDSSFQTSSNTSESTQSSNCVVFSNVEKGTVSENCKSEPEISDVQTTEITTSDVYHYKQNCDSCPRSSINITSCSLSHFNVKEISINSRETVHTGSSITDNGTDFSDDAQLSYTSDESSSVVSSIVNLQSKHTLDFNFKENSSSILTDIDASEYSATPTFFDIAEEGIRTIDACFREVGAEVEVLTTSYEDENSLPLLTSVKDNKTSSKVPNDNPPILEPCVSSAYQKNSENQIEKKDTKDFSESFQRSIHTSSRNYVTKSLVSNYSRTCNNLSIQNLTQKITYSSSHVILTIARKILRKYLKQSQCKLRLKYLQARKFKSIDKSKFSNRSDVSSVDRTMPSEVNRNNKSTSIKNSKEKSTSKSHLISCKMPNINKITHQSTSDKHTSNKTESMNHPVKKSSYLCDSKKDIKYAADVKKLSVISQTKNSTQSRSAVSTFVSTIQSKNRIRTTEHISRPPSTTYSCDYKSIRVSRNLNYTHIIMLFTRGKSIYLTLEALLELRDVVVRTNNDSGCQVLIINGIGDAFCSGLDLRPLVGPRKKIVSTEIAVAIKELIEALSAFKKPLAAVVNGPALGLGMTLLNHVDLAIASEKATFCMPYSTLGYMPEGGATLSLPLAVGYTRAMDILFRGKTLTAREAYNMGLIAEVLEARRLPEEMVSRVKTFSENSLFALETTKSLIKMQLHENLPLVLENEVKLLPRMWLTRTCQDSLRKALSSGIFSE